MDSPSNHLISSVTIETLGGHDHVHIWTRGGKAGTVIVSAGDGEAIRRRLLPKKNLVMVLEDNRSRVRMLQTLCPKQIQVIWTSDPDEFLSIYKEELERIRAVVLDYDLDENPSGRPRCGLEVIPSLTPVHSALVWSASEAAHRLVAALEKQSFSAVRLMPFEPGNDAYYAEVRKFLFAE